MGYSGKFFNHGTEEENKGDQYLLRQYFFFENITKKKVCVPRRELAFGFLEHAKEFTWFGHMWSHQQPHLYENISLLEGDMILNKNFAIVSFLLAHFLVNEYNLHQEIHNIYTGTWHSNEFRLLRFTPSFRSLSSPRIALRDVEEALEHPCHVNENIDLPIE